MVFTPRRLCSLAKALPADSMLVRSHTGGSAWGWDQELAATQVEATHALMRVSMAGFGARKSHIPEQLHIPRPHEAMKRKKQGPKRQATVREMVEILGPMLNPKGHT